MVVILDGNEVETVHDLHRILAATLDFGPYYGGNIAALWDRLSTDIERPLHIVWKDSNRSRAVIGDADFELIVSIFERTRIQDETLNLADRFTYSLE
jgi:ribonuclease inhibitor